MVVLLGCSGLSSLALVVVNDMVFGSFFTIVVVVIVSVLNVNFVNNLIKVFKFLDAVPKAVLDVTNDIILHTFPAANTYEDNRL